MSLVKCFSLPLPQPHVLISARLRGSSTSVLSIQLISRSFHFTELHLFHRRYPHQHVKGCQTTEPLASRSGLACAHRRCTQACSVVASTSYSPNRLNAWGSAMAKSPMKICGVESELVKRAMEALIRPLSHLQRHHNDFQSRPSILSVMS
ncbi:hypothetical protein SESBI_39336 [Sesbania bispinosa]|nr:hypothetical protein SESBI_39336 [Sesbania bispinosa]